MNFIPICKLCLVKVEQEQESQVLCDDTVKSLTKMLEDVFQGLVSSFFVYLTFSSFQ